MKEKVIKTYHLRLNEWGSIENSDSLFYNNLPFRMYFAHRKSRRFDTMEQLDRFFRQPVDGSYPMYIDVLEKEYGNKVL